MEQEPTHEAQTSTSMHSKPIAKPQRITQLQCLSSNSQLQLFFIQGLNQSFKYLPNVLSKIYNEIQLLVGFAEYRLTIAIDKPHPGDSLQNIKYNQTSMTKTTKILYLLFSVILPYIKIKLFNYVVHDSRGWKQKVLKFLTFLDKIIMALNLINLSIFIRNGVYRSLTQRVLKIPMEFVNGESGRILDFTLMNRRLIWSIYEMFLKTVLPFTHNLFGTTLKNIFYLNSYLNAQTDNKNNCTICGDRVKLPMKTSCGHMVCYYCYSTQVGEEDQKRKKQNRYKCKECGHEVKEWKKLF